MNKLFALSFETLTSPIARETVSAAVQKQLYGMGVKWNSGEHVTPIHLDQSVLTFHGSRQLKDSRLTYGNALEKSFVFDAATETEDFLDAVQNSSIHIEIIEGVSVTITAENIDLSPTDLLERVERLARQRQSELFPHSRA